MGMDPKAFVSGELPFLEGRVYCRDNPDKVFSPLLNLISASNWGLRFLFGN